MCGEPTPMPVGIVSGVVRALWLVEGFGILYDLGVVFCT
jgi:hypothetical protein